MKKKISAPPIRYEAPEALIVHFTWECELLSNTSPVTTGSGSEGWDTGSEYNW